MRKGNRWLVEEKYRIRSNYRENLDYIARYQLIMREMSSNTHNLRTFIIQTMNFLTNSAIRPHQLP